MIDGLKVTLTGEELRKVLAMRAARHRDGAEYWSRERDRPIETQTEEHPVLPEHMCDYEAQRHEWRASVLEFLRDRLEPAEIYRLGESDLTFGELLPPKPGCVDQEEFEERNRIGLGLEKIGRRICWAPEIIAFENPDYVKRADRADAETLSAANLGRESTENRRRSRGARKK